MAHDSLSELTAQLRRFADERDGINFIHRRISPRR